MKKIPILSIIALILISACLVFAFTYQTKIPAKEEFAADSAYMQSENLALNAVCDSKKLTDGKAETSFQSLKKENFYVTLDLGKAQKINSVILKEKGLNVKEFSISVSADGEAYEAMERVVAKKNTDVYLEAMEEAENKGGKPKEIVCPNGRLTETETHGKAIGLLQEVVYYSIP